MALLKKEQNLISLAWPEGYADPTTSSNTTPRTFSPKTYVVGLGSTNYYRRNYADWVLNPSVSEQNGVMFTSGGASGYGIGFVVDNFEGGKTYDISFIGNSPCAFMYYGSDGTYLGNTTTSLQSSRATAPSNATVGILCFYAGKARTAYECTDIKIIKVKE